MGRVTFPQKCLNLAYWVTQKTRFPIVVHQEQGGSNIPTQHSADHTIQSNIDNFLATQRLIFEHQQDSQRNTQPDITNYNASSHNNQITTRIRPDHISQITLATHNINGIRQDTTKLQQLLTYTTESNIDVVVITETNITPLQGRHIGCDNFGYRSIWTGSMNKIKGIGVAILIAEHLEPHICSTNTTAVPDYLIHLQLLFKGCQIHIIGLYYPPSDRQIQSEITRYVKKVITANSNKTDIHTIVLGDFNAIMDTHKDVAGNTRFYRKPSTLLNTLDCHMYIDTYRALHPNDRKFTWSSTRCAEQTISTRIDHIWVSPNWIHDITYANIDDADLITGSDHNIVICQLHTGTIIRNWKLSEKRRHGKPRIVFDFHNTTDAQWSQYRILATNKFENDKILHKHLQETNITQQDVDIIWKSIAHNINSTAKDTLPHKEVTFSNQRKPKKLLDFRPSGLLNVVTQLRHIIFDLRKHPSLSIINAEINSYNQDLQESSIQQSIYIPIISYPLTPNCIEEMEQSLKLLKKHLKVQTIINQQKEIKEHLDRRAEDTITNQSRMLASVLNRDFRRIKIDRLVTVEDGKPILHTSPQDILKIAPTQYEALRKPRKHQFNNIDKDWAHVYEPIERINSSIYTNLMSPPDPDEWWQSITKCSLTSAPGRSGIGYRLIKHLPNDIHIILRAFAGVIFETGYIPQDWKLSQIYPIPKPYEWEFSLEKTRPIILLECLRKLYVRILNTRLGNICLAHDILQGPNFAGLPGGNTRTPVHILNNIMEDARDQKKQCWIAFQDMSKAFDSIGMVPLKKALERIKLPSTAVKFLINLFDGRSMRIITEYGLSDAFTAADGIDQGEVISPLIWRIFYDPLLCRISQDPTLGYHMKVNWPAVQHSCRISTLAYADDTAWIAPSKNVLQRTIDISNQFFRLNDIDINGKKSELLVIHPHRRKLPDSYLSIMMGSNPCEVKASQPSETIRYLGVWFASKQSKKQQMGIVKKEIAQITTAIKGKHLTIDQVVYVNNRVLIPRLEYRLSTSLFNVTDNIRLFCPMTKVAKQLMNIPANAHTNIIAHPGLTGLITLQQNQLHHHFTEFNIRINDNTLATTTTLLRLRYYQLKHKIVQPIWQLQLEDMIRCDHKDNLSANILTQMRTWNFSLQQQFDLDDWKLPGMGHSILTLLSGAAINEGKKKLMIGSYLKTSLPIFTINQCLTSDSRDYISWSSLKAIHGQSRKGRIPLWYNFLQTIYIPNTEIISHNLDSNMEISMAPNQDRRSMEWISYSGPRTNNQSIYGKIIYKTQSGSSCTFIHWTSAQLILQPHVHEPCTGCSYTTATTNEGLCSIQGRRLNAQIISTNRLHRITYNQFNITPTRPRMTQPDNNELRLSPTIPIPSRDVQLIQQSLKSQDIICNILIEKHHRIAEWMSHHNKIEFYTDGSIDPDSEDDTTIMGSSWTILDIPLSFSCAVVNWPSSTRAELIAIWTALLASPSLAHIEIFTDSKAAMDAISAFNQLSIRQKISHPNSSVINHILYLTNTKQLRITYTKVKSHSGNVGNDIADDLAKDIVIKARDTPGLIISTTCIHNGQYNYNLHWNNQPWEGAMRRNINILTGLQICADWAKNNNIRSLFNEHYHNYSSSSIDRVDNLNRLDSINRIDSVDSVDSITRTADINYNWDYTWTLFKTLRELNRFGPASSNFNSFALKILNNCLPTGDRLQQRQPHLYNNWSCLFCNSQDETLIHLFECPALHDVWSNIHDSIFNYFKSLTTLLKIRMKDYLSADDFIHTNDLFSTKELSQGKVSTRTERQLEQDGLRSNKKVVYVGLLKHAISQFREQIWKPRCTKQAEKERLLGITKQAKRTFIPPHTTITDPIRHDDHTTSHFQQLKDRWKDNTEIGLKFMGQYIRKGNAGLEKGFGVNKFVVKSVGGKLKT